MKKKPLFTAQELAGYVKKCGYAADTRKMYQWYVDHSFRYRSGKRWYNLKNWKIDVRHKLKYGKFNATKIPTGQQANQRKQIVKKLDKMFKRPYYGFRSTRVFEQKRQKAIRDFNGKVVKEKGVGMVQ